MAFGTAAIGLWPALAIANGLMGAVCAVWLIRAIINRPQERPRLLGLLLFLSSTALLAFGIGWGRCGFTDGGHPGDMGFASRYGWIVWPGLGLIYFQWLICGGPHLSRWGPIVLFGIVAFLLPFNVGTGVEQGEGMRAYNAVWEKSIRDGMTDEELINTYFPGYQGGMLERMQLGLYLLRKHHFHYYRPLPSALPDRRESGTAD
jgi:hypothetical protein